MTESLNRKIARRYSKAVSNENIRSDGTLPATATVYDSTSSLPTSGIARGSQAYVSSNQRLYIRGTGGWYNIATINNTPSINSVQTAGGDSSPFDLAIDGATTTVVTITATDSEGFPITFSVVTDAGFDSIATVSQDSSVFTITPFSEDSVGTATSGTLTFKATDGVNIASEVATFTLTFAIVNSKFTDLLMKASGNDGVNTAINDASSNTHTITRNGTPTTQAFTPYHPGGYSTYFDGTGDYLSLSDHASLQMGSGDFTIEAWVYVNAHKNSNYIYSYSFPYQFTMDSNGHLESYFNDGDNFNSYIIVQGSTAIPTSTWTHVAVVRNGNTFTQFVNGVQDGTVTSSATLATPSSYDPIIGNWGGGSYSFDGYIKDLRIVKGTAVYTATFAPPTKPLTAITNTSLLACNLPYIADGSSNGHSITASGNTKVQRFAPYDFLQYKVNNNGASVYFDGTGDYLTVAHNTNLELENSDFTLECFVYPTSTNGAQIIGKRSAGANYGGYAIYWSSSKFGALIDTDTSTPWAVSLVTTETFLLNQWYHVAFTRNGNNVYLYVNGIQKDTTSFSGTANTNSSTSFSVGAIGNGDQPLTGYISDVRLVKGTAVYTSAFTPPTAPLSSVSGTSILTCNDAADILDSTTGKLVTLYGNAKSSTSQNKNASSAMFFDGTGDYITTEFPAFGTDDFTIEFWMRPDTVNSNFKALMDTRTSNTNNPLVWIKNSNVIYFYAAGSERITGTTTISTDTWYHVSLVRTNGVSQLFLNGTQEGSDYVDTNNYTASTLFIGQRYTGTPYNYNGTIEDFRITKGLGRYPFIPPSETLSAISGTQLLACHAATIVDGSSNSFTINSNSSPAVVDFGPHPGMKSVSFDGTDDRLYIADGDYKTFGTGEYTIECWIYPEEISQGTFGDYFWGDGSTSQNASGANELMYTTDDKLRWYFITTGGSNTITSPFALTPYKWYHVACQRKGNVFQMFVNGSLAVSTNAGAVTMNDASGVWTIGDYGHTYGTGAPPKCKISNFRIVKGSAVYSNSFTAPTSELKG